jgi:hypothetical protein
MAVNKLVNRAWMSTLTTGTGTVTLASALSGYQSFASAGVANSDKVRYVIIDGSNWEIGVGTYTSSGTTLTRTPSESSNSGAAISLSGSASVFVTGIADDFITTGYHLVGCWPARAMVKPTTSGAGNVTQDESSTNKVNTEYVAFANAATSYLQLDFRAPEKLDESATLDVEIEWKEADSATAHVCRWQAEAQAQGDGDTVDSAWGTAVAADDTGSSGTRRKIKISAITPGGTWVAGDAIIVRIARLGSHANDTLDVAAHFIRATVFATVNAKADA